jgi:hypothetical protein
MLMLCSENRTAIALTGEPLASFWNLTLPIAKRLPSLRERTEESQVAEEPDLNLVVRIRLYQQRRWPPVSSRATAANLYSVCY